MTHLALAFIAQLVLDTAPSALELETPRLGASQERPAGVDRPGAADRVRPPPPPPPAPTPGQDRASTRWLMIAGGAAIIVALALNANRRKPEPEPPKDPHA